MAASTSYNGDDLLKLFADLNIELGSLNPNVIRAFYDTDDVETLNVLNFMCSSLSKKNVLTPQERQDFEALKEPLHDDGLKTSMKIVEDENPNIFDYELNCQLLKIYNQELEHLEQEEQRLDNSIKINENLQQNLFDNKSSFEENSAKLDFKCEEARKKCEELSQVLDDMNLSLYEKVIEDISHLTNFQFNKTEFFNLMNLEDIEDSDAFCTSIQDVVRKQHEDLSGNFSESKINLNSTPYDDNLADCLETSRSRICSSYMEYLNVKVEEVSLIEALNYLENFFAENYLSNCNKTLFSEEVFNSKVGQKAVLFELLGKKAVTVSEEPIYHIQIEKAKNELKNIQDNLLCFTEISKYYTNVLCINSLALMLFLQEKKSIHDSDQLIRHVSRYILNSLNDSRTRTDIMETTIETFKDFKGKPIENRNQIVESIMDVYDGNILEQAFSNSNQQQKKLITLQQDYFVNNSELWNIVQELFKNDLITKFLYSGPTNRALVIPTEIQTSLKSIRLNFDKQASAVKFSVQVITNISKQLNTDNWLKNSRILWGYFLTSPEKLQHLFKQLYEELKAREVKSVRFKD